MAPLRSPRRSAANLASSTAALTLLLASSSPPSSYALLPTPTLSLRSNYARQPSDGRRRASSSSSLRMNFLGDMFKDAFANDSNLSSDKSSGQLEGPGIEDGSGGGGGRELTEVQRNFLASEQIRRSRSASMAAGKGAPVDPALLAGTTWTLDFYLAGIPERDPSNDLYGQRINISNRDRSMGMGMAEVPEEPTVSAVAVTLDEDGVCKASPSDFTSGEVGGEWKLSDDGRYLRLSVDCLGYKRTIQTKGTIQKVFWSDADEVSTKTSTSYSIPPGLIYCDIPVGYGLPGQLVMKGQGALRVEQTSGLLGISSKMVQCGKFEGTMMLEGGEAGSAASGMKGEKKGAL